MTLRANHTKHDYAPLNSHFTGAAFHHLHYRPRAGGIDNSIGLYIPAPLHNAIKHSHLTGVRMHEMNLLALQWYMLFTPGEMNPVAVGLYTHYKNMTRPQIQEEQNKIWEENPDTDGPPPVVDLSYHVPYGLIHTIKKICDRVNAPRPASVDAFINDFCEVTPLSWESRDALHNAYIQFANDHGCRPIGKTQFGLTLLEMGFERERSTKAPFKGFYYAGLQLKGT